MFCENVIGEYSIEYSQSQSKSLLGTRQSVVDKKVRVHNSMKNEPIIRVADPLFQSDSMPVNIQRLRLCQSTQYVINVL